MAEGEVKEETQLVTQHEKPKCEECNDNVAKYKCPGCDLRSCSLVCVRAHKERTSCSGKRDRTSFVPVSSFDENRLLSDYNLLEEMLRNADSAKRFRSQYEKGKPGVCPPRWALLRRHAKKRKIDLVYLPEGMTKRIENCSKFCRKQKIIRWTVEWKFFSTELRLLLSSVDEAQCPASVLERHLATNTCPNMENLYNIRKFCKKPLENLRFFLANEDERKGFIELDASQPLGFQFFSVRIIEYPSILVVPPNVNIDFKVIEDRRGIKPPSIENDVEEECIPYKEEEIEGEIVD